MPDGVVQVVFDNEQRLVKSYLTRGDTKVKLDIFTNVLGVVLPEPDELNHRQDFKTSKWPIPKQEDVLQNLVVPRATSHTVAESGLRKYVASHLNYISSLESDPVAELIESKEENRSTLECPECHTKYERRVRNSKNPQCSVVNIRAAKASRADTVVREFHREPRTHVAPRTFLWSSAESEGRVRVARSEQEDEVAVPPVSEANCVLLEPCFVNPASLAALKELLRHVGELGDVSQYEKENPRREWMALSCDGVPYMLRPCAFFFYVSRHPPA